MYEFVALGLSLAFVAFMIWFYCHTINLNDSVDGPRPVTIVPDLVFFYKCAPSNDMMADDLKIDLFLQKNGFTVQDTGEIDRELGISEDDLQGIFAIDAQKRMINITDAPNDAVDHDVSLQSEPPTIHATKFEHDFQAFISDGLKCHISDLSTDNNPASSKGFYDRMFQADATNIWEFHLRDLSRKP